MNVIDEVAEPHRSVLESVLRDQDPDLLAELQATGVPTFRQSVAVSDAVATAMSEHFLPGHEPDEAGKAIDDALGAFYLRWPHEDLADPPGR